MPVRWSGGMRGALKIIRERKLRRRTIIRMIIIMILLIRRTEGTEEQGVSDPEHLSFLAA